VRSLFARWAPKASAPPSLVGGRLGLETAWTVHIDPSKMSKDLFDISGSNTKPVNEIAFLGSPGLELAAMEVAVCNAGNSSQSIMLLKPADTTLGPTSLQTDASFTVEMVSAASAAQRVISLQEAIDQNLRFNVHGPSQPVHSQVSTLAAPGLLTGSAAVALVTSAIVDSQLQQQNDVSFAIRALENEDMFSHGLLSELVTSASLQDLLLTGKLDFARAAHHVAGDLCKSKKTMTKELRELLRKKRKALGEAIFEWISVVEKSHLQSVANLVVEQHDDNDDTLADDVYLLAKRRQTKLDLLTVAFLHGHNM